MTKKRKGNPKYFITNLSTEEVILNDLTQKASLEWLREKYDELDEKGHIEFAKAIYGKELTSHEFHITTIRSINEVAIVDRFKKSLNKVLIFNEEQFKIQIQKD